MPNFKVYAPKAAELNFDVSQNSLSDDITSPEGGAGYAAGEVYRFDAMAQRCQRLDTSRAGLLSSIEILTQPSNGHVGINDDLSLSLVLTRSKSETASVFTYRATYPDETTADFSATIIVEPCLQEEGWAEGLHYLPETTSSDRVVVKKSSGTRTVYATKGAAGWTAAEIEAEESLTGGTVDAAWVMAQDVYGYSEAAPLDAGLARDTWERMLTFAGDGDSHWLLLERGYDYTDIGAIAMSQRSGSMPLHPLYIGAWGAGSAPILPVIRVWGNQTEYSGNVVIEGVSPASVDCLTQIKNVCVTHCSFSKDGSRFQGDASQDSFGFTLRNSTVRDLSLDEPRDGGSDWEGLRDRVAGFFVSYMSGALIENSVFDHVGWRDGYSTTDTDGSNPQPPNPFSHNLYMQDTALDVTYRDNFSARAASHGAQFRAGAHLERSVFADNNVALNVLGGDYESAGTVAHISSINKVLVMGAGARANPFSGATGWGIEDIGEHSQYQNAIVCNGIDPARTSEESYKTGVAINNGWAKTRSVSGVADVVVWNWGTSDDLNVTGLTEATMNGTTVFQYAENVAGLVSPDWSDVIDHFAGIALIGDFKAEMHRLIGWVLPRFGKSQPATRTAGAIRFNPITEGNGVRGDDERNWSPESVPQDGDDVFLNGFDVNWGGTASVDSLTFGAFGKLNVIYGKITVADVLDTGQVVVGQSGEMEVQAVSGGFDLSVDGGIFRNTGAISGSVSVAVLAGASDAKMWGVAALACSGGSFTVSDDLTINGTKGRVGFDGAGGSASITLASAATLSLVADGDGIPQIGRAWTGCYSANTVSRTVNLGGATLDMDLSALAGTGSYTIVDADTVTGTLTEGSIAGLGSRDLDIAIGSSAVVATLSAGTGLVTIS